MTRELILSRKKEVTVGLIEDYLDQAGWNKHERRAGLDVIRTGWVAEAPGGEHHDLDIRLLSDANGLVFAVTKIASAPTDATPSDRLSGLLLAIAAINARLVLGGFAYDPSDGELVFRLGIPTDGNDLCFEEFEHCIKAVALTVNRYAADLREIIDGTKTAQDVLG